MKKIKESELTRKIWIDRIADRFENGDHFALFQLLIAALDSDPDIPESTKIKIRIGLLDYESGKRKTLDDAFGISNPMTPAERKKRMYRTMVFLAVKKERKRLKESGNPKSEDAFANVAERLNLGSPAQIRNYYYEEYNSQKESKPDFEIIPG